MDLIPVLDLRHGLVVRGHAGQRGNYQPNTSLLISSSGPQATIEALIQQFSPRCVYLADLDGIENQQPQYELIGELVKCNVPLAIDAGTSSPENARKLLELGVQKVVVGLETLPRLDAMQEFIQEFGPEKILFSLDLMNGDCIGPDAVGHFPLEVAAATIRAGVRQLIVLDIAQVGSNRGVSTISLCHSIKNRWPDLVIWTGGGVRSIVDLHKLSLSRVDGAMVASALHDGHITPADWKNFLALSNDLTQMAMDA